MIEIRNLSGGYGGTDIVKGITATFENGCLTVIVGANGCGKTTLLRLCGGLLRAAGGEIKIDGRNVVCYSRTELAQRISVLPQSRAVPDITAGALVLHGRFPWLGYPRVYRAEDKAAAEKAMERVGIMDKRHKLLANISGGERQRVYTAMLLAQDTKNLLLDEPTTYLDVARQLELAELLRGLKSEGKCVVAVLHDLSLAIEIADRMAVMANGGLTAMGPPEEIISSGAVEEAFNVKLKREERYRFTKA